MLSLRWLDRVLPMGGIAVAWRGLASVNEPAPRAPAVHPNNSRRVNRPMVSSPSGKRPSSGNHRVSVFASHRTTDDVDLTLRAGSNKTLLVRKDCDRSS